MRYEDWVPNFNCERFLKFVEQAEFPCITCETKCPYENWILNPKCERFLKFVEQVTAAPPKRNTCPVGSSDTPVTVWIVDYDLPEGNSRRRFYRRIKAWLKAHDGTAETGWSTQSVVITRCREFAEFVYAAAAQLGHAHMYRAEKVK